MELELKKLNLQKEEKRPLVLAGPCSAESLEQVLTTAHKLKDSGINIFRAGVWKPRTKPGSFEGHGDKALPWLKQVKEETGMLIATEVATPEHVDAALKAGVDIFWIGARTTANPFAVQAIANSLRGIDIPVLVKNPINPDLELWIGALERLNGEGIKRLGVIHRGFSSYDHKIYRYEPMWQIPIELKRRIKDLPIICDPSHMGGKRELIAPISQQAMDLGMDGLIIESHCNPDNAWSDSSQQITPETLDYILSTLVIRNEPQSTENISLLRHQIDDIDNQIIEELAKRMRICREIGVYKKEHDMTIVHNDRYSEIIDKRGEQGSKLGVDQDCIKNIFGLIHQESVRQQYEIINKNEKDNKENKDKQE
ncbi:MAG: bifunctional 3-deoxy-7-phosphoheptulonate synthase/chorismate mutase type II [Bacteroidaceae bacterium]|nr:bifunctional 3-deoxy-7-phosphoheptulonate synthase/chorismate mutase type II [Bacteroidaceae bacterium]